MSTDGSGESDGAKGLGVEVLLFVLGAVVLAYLGGAFSAAFRTFPYPQLLEKPFKALAAQQEKRSITKGSVLATGLWHPARVADSGVVRRKPQKMFGEYTLYTSGDHAGAFLLDSKGEVVHQWSAPFRNVWNQAPHVDEPIPKSHIYWRRAHLFPNGDIIASYSGEGDTPYGYGLARFDSDSNLLWKYSDHVHHDFDVGDDGSVVALAHGFRHTKRDPVGDLPQFQKLVLEDFLVYLSPEGTELRRVSLLDAIVDSRFRTLLESYPKFIDRGLESRWDPLHTNTADVVGPDFASHHRFAEPGQVMVSFRNTDAIALVDMKEKRLTWSSRGFWSQQHDPDPLPNGHILLFDNNGNVGPQGGSRVVEFDPSDQSTVWSYRGSAAQPFWSIGRSSQQLLPNGNVLITESAGGRIFEITRSGEIVWQFYNPSRRTKQGVDFIPIVCSAQRFTAEQLDFIP